LAIRFVLAPDQPDRVAFAYSPLLELVLSLHVLVEPKHHPLQHEWVRRMRRLRPALRRAIGGFAFLYRRTIPNCFLPSGADEYGELADELARFRALPPHVLLYELIRPLHDHGGGEARLDEPEVRAVIERRAELLGGDNRRRATALLDDPVATAGQLADVLAAYWEEAFAAEWEALEPELARSVADAGRVVAEDGVYRVLVRLAPQLRVDLERHEFGLDVPHEHRVAIEPGAPLVLVPSAFVWPHVLVNCDEPWAPTLVYAPPFVTGREARELPPAELLRGLRALGDATRLGALRLIAERPRSTQELAPLIGISQAGLSKHLRALADAGLVTTRREGYYVLYSVVPERVEAIASAVPTYLGV
jgi:DNA-binding transcriptional ArsR family regulator